MTPSPCHHGPDIEHHLCNAGPVTSTWPAGQIQPTEPLETSCRAVGLCLCPHKLNSEELCPHHCCFSPVSFSRLQCECSFQPEGSCAGIGLGSGGERVRRSGNSVEAASWHWRSSLLGGSWACTATRECRGLGEAEVAWVQTSCMAPAGAKGSLPCHSLLPCPATDVLPKAPSLP